MRETLFLPSVLISKMRKIFFTVVFFTITQLVLGQCYDINNFVVTSNPSTCLANGQITIKAPDAATPACTATLTVELKMPSGNGALLKSVVTGQSVIFNDLAPGEYSVLLHDSSGVPSNSKTAKVDGTYKKLDVTGLALCGATMSRTSTTSPAFSEENGTITFTIVGGTGIGTDFDVSLEDAVGNVLVPVRRITRPNATTNFAYTLAKSATTDRIPSGVKVYLVIKNVLPSGLSGCEEETKRVEITMPPEIYMPGSYNIIWGVVGLRTEGDCKYSLGLNISRGDGNTVHFNGGCRTNDILAHFRATGRATIKVIHSSDPSRVGVVDNLDYYIPNPLRGFNGWGYRTHPLYLEGDELLITVDDGFGSVIQRQFKLDVKPNGGFGLTNTSSEASACEPYLRIKTNFSNSRAKTFPNLVSPGGTIPVTYQWANAYTRANWLAGKFSYRVEKEQSGGTYTLVAHTEKNYDLIDVTPHGAGKYRVSVVSGAGCPVSESVVTVDYVTTSRFDKAFNSLEKNYGIYQGTSSFRMPMPTDLYYTHPTDPVGTPSKAKLTITRVDGQTSMSFSTSLFFETPTTKTINFPIELPLVPSSIDASAGVDFIGLGDFPPGEYTFKLEDACDSSTRNFTFTDVINLSDASYNVVKNCDTNEITFTLGTSAPNRSFIHTYLQRKNASGGWDHVDARNFSVNGTFTNLVAGTYRLQTRNYYYIMVGTTSPREYIWTLLPPFANLPLTGRKTSDNPYVQEEVRGYSPEIEIKSHRFQPYVSGISCGNTNGSGMIIIDLSLSELADENITYTLYKEQAGGSQTMITSITQPSTSKTHSFPNLDNGKYKVVIKSDCIGEHETQLIDINSDDIFKLPAIEASQDICPGTIATMKIDISPTLFDINWYRTDPVTGVLQGPLGSGQTYSEVVTKSTTYHASVSLKSSFGCASGDVTTQTVTVTMVNDTMPPTITFFPENQELTIQPRDCTVSATWLAPAFTDTCSVTVTSTHTSPLSVGIGTHTVTYTFTDASGNSIQRNLVLSVKPSDFEASLEGVYTDGTSQLMQLVADQLFYYEVSYAKVAPEIISSATLTVQLPANANVAPSTTQTIDLSEAGTGATQTYNATNKSYTIVIPNFVSTGGKIKIPLQLSGGQALAAKPCMNLQEITTTMVYQGGGATCLRTETATTTPSIIEIDTSTYSRSVIGCNATVLTAEAGFTTYQWFRGTTLLSGETRNVYTPTVSGQYRVEKNIVCGTRSVTSYEVFDYTSPVEITDVEVLRDKVNCVHSGQLKVESVNGSLPHRYMARIHTSAFPTLADFTTPNVSDVVTNFGDNVLSLPIGKYKIYVLDSSNCIKEYNSAIDITQAREPKIDDIKVDVCNPQGGMYNAEIHISFGETTSNHSYTLDGGNSEPITTSPFTISNLSSGIHTLRVMDADGCGQTQTFTVNTSVQMGVVSVTRELSCSNPTAQITLTNISGGTGVYTYELVQVVDRANNIYTSVVTATITIPTGTTTSVSVDVTNTGEYEFRVKDSNMLACPNPVISNSVVVESAKLPEIDARQTKVVPAFCYGASEGSIEMVSNSPSLEPIDFKIIESKDLGTGLITTLNILPTSSTSNSAKFTALAGTTAGIEYTVELTGNNGCKKLIKEIITSGLPISANNALTAKQFSCLSGTNLEATISFDVNQVVGASSSYTWEYFNKATGVSIGGNNQPNVIISDLNGGTFYVEVRDAIGGCMTKTNEVTIAPAFTLSNIVAAAQTPITCATDEQVSVSVETLPQYVAGTELRFVAKRLSDNLTISETFSSTLVSSTVSYTFSRLLPSGDYEISVENLKTQCPKIVTSHKVADLSDKFEIKSSKEKHPSCHRGNDGEITLTFVDKKPTEGGDKSSEGFTYTVTHITTNQITTGSIPVGVSEIILPNLAEGNYHIEAVSVANSCMVTTLFTIPQSPSEIVVSTGLSSPFVSCVTNKGDIVVEVIGGKAPYVVTLSSGETQTIQGTTATFTGISAGIYTITLQDSFGCSTYTGTHSVELKTPDAMVASVTTTHISCGGYNDGKITITNITGGSVSKTYVYTLESVGTPIIEQTSNIFENLKPGNYKITVTDGLGCKMVTNTTVIEPVQIEAFIDVTGSDRLVCYGASDGYVKVKAKGGTQPYSIDIYSEVTNVRVNSVSHITPNPINPLLAPEIEVVTDPILAPGSYYLKVTDANGCAVTTTVFTVEEFPDINPKEVYQDKFCNSNTFHDPIVVRFAKPVDVKHTFYILNGARASFSRVEGNYAYIDNYDRTISTQGLVIEYLKEHSDGLQLGQCLASVWTLTIEETESLTATNVLNTKLNTIEVKAEGGVAPYRYSFNGQDQGSSPVYVLKINDPGHYNSVTKQIIKEIPVEVTDALGCTYSLTVTQVYHDITIPNFFTPDGDGRNDVWKPENAQNYPNLRIYIYDRHGRKITTLTSVDAWYGIYEGKHMPTGDYWYILELNDVHDTRRFYGNFTLYR